MKKSKSGELYTWGFGSAGRLGLNNAGETSDPRSDATRPTLVQSLLGLPVANVSCGFAHTAAVTADARLFVWGSGATGKLGLGPVAGKEECFCPMPTPLVLGSAARVRAVSCGSAHTAAVTDDGRLFVWGCGDGGRLGLGLDRMQTAYRPTLVDVNGAGHPKASPLKGSPAFGGQRVALVSCGNACTLVATAVREVAVGVGADRVTSKIGGEVFMAGAASVLGSACPTFTRLDALAHQPMAMISAGYSTHDADSLFLLHLF